jgi:hypothetical protein
MVCACSNLAPVRGIHRSDWVMAEAAKSLPRAAVAEPVKALMEQDGYGMRAGLASVVPEDPE